MQNAHTAYAKTAKTTLSPRELESQLLIRAAARLQSVRDGWPDSGDDLIDSLNFNKKLWTILSTSATSSDNPLPQSVKNNIGSLAVFIFSRSFEIEFSREPAKISALININREIAAGLSAMPTVSSPPLAPATAS